MTTEAIISIVALAFIFSAICWLIRVGRSEAETIFESDYYNLKEFIKTAQVNSENEVKIITQLNHLAGLKYVDREKLQVLNSEFRRKFAVSLSDVVCHESTEQ